MRDRRMEKTKSRIKRKFKGTRMEMKRMKNERMRMMLMKKRRKKEDDKQEVEQMRRNGGR